MIPHKSEPPIVHIDMDTIIIETVGVIAATLDLAIAIPQAWKIRKNKNATSVSLITWSMLYATLVSWGVYGYRYSSLPLALGFTIGATVIAVFVLTGILKYNDHTRLTKTLVLIGIPLFSIPFIWFVPKPVITVYLVLLTFNRIPQIIKSYKAYKTSTPTNVSITTWIMGMLANIAWLTYGLLRNDYSIILVTIAPIFYDALTIIYETYNKGNRKINP